MAILKIARMGHPALRRPAEEVADPGAPEIQALVSSMLDTLRDAGGVGLAAPQVHVAKRIVLYFVPAERMGVDGSEPVPTTVLVNPILEAMSSDTAWGWEGCLSVPGLMGAVERPVRVRVRAAGLDGEALDFIAEGYHARVVQHECDHLDGILYPQRMTDMTYLMFSDETRHGTPALPDETPKDRSGPDGRRAAE